MINSLFDEAARAQRVSMGLAQLALDTQSVIAMRLWGQAGTWAVARNEGTQMLREKPPAFAESYVAATTALFSGATAFGVAAAALAPISEAARDNRARLAALGPRRWVPDGGKTEILDAQEDKTDVQAI